MERAGWKLPVPCEGRGHGDYEELINRL